MIKDLQLFTKVEQDETREISHVLHNFVDDIHFPSIDR